MNKDVLVEANHVSKKFCRNLKRSLFYGVCDIARDLAGGNADQIGLRKQEFWANSDLSFQVRRGESIGIIGNNGAGKTTLLKMLNGLIRPDRGNIKTRGQVGALIALGAGFNPLLTGRENIHINASILGLSKKQIAEQIDEIIAFSELENFIDTPLQSYSSGMAVRLGFAVASALNPDILILDEVLAVGDAAFRSKCFARLGKIRDKTAIFFVSHNAAQVSLICDSVLYLKQGTAAFYGDCSEGLEFYADDNQKEVEKEAHLHLMPEIDSVSLCNRQTEIVSDTELEFSGSINSNKALQNVAIRLMFYDVRRMPIADCYTKRDRIHVDLKKGDNTFKLKLKPLNLKPDRYYVSFIVETPNGMSRYVDSIHHLTIDVKGALLGGMAVYGQTKSLEFS